MSNHNSAAVEHVIEEVTREVLLRMGHAVPVSNTDGCNCTDGSCVAHCADKVGRVVSAGASRVTSRLGALPQDGDVARLIDHTLLKADATQDQIAQLCYEARTHHFVVDGPVQNGCPGEELTPPELFLSSVAACGAELVQVIARQTDVKIGPVNVAIHGVVDRSRQARPDVTVFNSVELNFTIHGTDGASAAALVEGFKRR